MSKFNEIANQFKQDKKDTSPFIKLGDGESVEVRSLRSMKSEKATDTQTAKEYAEMIFKFDVETADGMSEKVFKTSSEKLVTTMSALGIDIGSSFKITKKGTGLSTTYEVTDVVNKTANGSQGTPATNLQVPGTIQTPAQPSQGVATTNVKSAPVDSSDK